VGELVGSSFILLNENAHLHVVCTVQDQLNAMLQEVFTHLAYKLACCHAIFTSLDLQEKSEYLHCMMMQETVMQWFRQQTGYMNLCSNATPV